MHAAFSSLIASYGYDEKTLDLDICFKSGPTWRYAGVPRDVFLEFVRSSSKGKFFLANIRSKYTERKL